MPSFDYTGSYAYHIILTTSGRAPAFSSIPVANACASRLEQVADKVSFRILAYCFMPDHVHALVLGRDNSANLLTFVQRFKQATSFYFKRRTGRQLWQQSFYDRTLRAEDDLPGIAEYIFANPVKAGLAAEAGGYPLSGGQYFKLDEAEAPSLRLIAAPNG